MYTDADMSYHAHFRCIAGCHGEHPLTVPLYRCPTCGDLLEVVHDLDALKDRSPAAWMRLFDDRYKRTTWPFGSAVWGKKEWVIPTIPDEAIVSMDEGGTNMLWAERYGKSIGVPDLWIKQCGNSHTGSFKDLGMTVLVSVVRQMQLEGKSIRAVACASTGDTSASLAAYAAAAGIPAIVILPRGKVSTAQLLQPLANGALVLALDTDFDGCMAIVQRLSQEEGVYLANSMNSLRLEGQKTVAIEIVQQWDWEVPDVVVIPGGNLGNVSALGAGFDMMTALGLTVKKPRIIVAQAARANPLYRAYQHNWEFEPVAAQPTLASAIQIGNPGVGEEGDPHAAALRAGSSSRRPRRSWRTRRLPPIVPGLFNCPHTGVALAALAKLVKRGDVTKSDRVVVISTANGLKFTDFKLQYHEGTLPGISPTHGNRPVELPNEYDAVRKAIDHIR